MSSCGLKGSLCQDDEEETSEQVDPLQQRFSFVDGKTGLWTVGGVDYGNISCPVGGMIVFHFPVGSHDIVQLSSKGDWDACRLNLNSSSNQLLAPLTGTNSSFSDMTYYYNCTEAGEIAYLTCSVPGHCQAKQKVVIQTSETEYAYNQYTGNWTIHVDSLSRVLRLLGYRQSTSQDGLPITIMDRGYQTEELANVTTNLIWCGLDHCPGFAHDFDPSASLEDCESMVFTLMGFVSRKRPIPQWDVSEDYYQRAIERGGSNVCTAQSYLTQLYMTKGDWVNASFAVSSLCYNCESETALVQQARMEYETLGIAVADFDFDRVCTQAKDSSSSSGGPSIQHSEMLGISMLLFTLFMISTLR